MLHQINGSQHIGVGHVWPCQLDSLNGNHCLANMVNTGCMGIPKSLPDYVIKVRVHAASLPQQRQSMQLGIVRMPILTNELT